MKIDARGMLVVTAAVAALTVVAACTPDPSTPTTTSPPTTTTLTVPDTALNVLVASGTGSVVRDQDVILGPFDVSDIARLGLVAQAVAPCADDVLRAWVYGVIPIEQNGSSTTMTVPLFVTQPPYSFPVYFSNPLPPTIQLRIEGLGLEACEFRVALWGRRT